MDKNILKSSIKAYCLELMQEISSLGAGGEGAYTTKYAGRKVTSQDKNSPTGFESSPNPNMYTKTMKFRIVKPNERLNSKDLWENNEPTSNNFPIKITSYEKGQVIGSWLQKHGYKVNLNDLPFDINPVEKPYYIYNNGNKTIDWSDQLSEITINNPTKLKLIPGQYYDFIKYKGRNAVKAFKANNRFHSLEEINGEKILWELGFKYKGIQIFEDEIFEDNKYHEFFDPWDGDPVGFGIDDVNDWIDEGLIRNGKKQPNSMNESRYSQFKKQTSKSQPKEILHKAIKEIQMKLDEVNKLIDFTSRIKGELTEGDQEVEYLKRTQNSLFKIQDKLKEAFKKVREFSPKNEI